MQNRVSEPENGTDAPYTGFLQIYDNEKTRENYRTALQKHLRFIICGNPETPLKNHNEKTYDTTAENYLEELKAGRNHAYDLIRFTNALTKTYAASTVRTVIRTICLWLEDNSININRQTKKRIFRTIPKTNSSRPETELTRKLFKTLHCQLTKDWAKTLLIILLSTGLRLGEALSLKETDIIKTRTRTELHIRAETTKTKTKRTVYLTKEAADALETYLSKRKKGEYRTTGERKRNTDRETESRQKNGSEKEDYIFPYTKAAAERQMRNAADRAGYGKNGENLRPVHWHLTRKWFISRVSLYVNKDAAEELAGHEGYLSRSYRRFTARQMLAAFKKAEKYLTLFPDITKYSATQHVTSGSRTTTEKQRTAETATQHRINKNKKNNGPEGIRTPDLQHVRLAS